MSGRVLLSIAGVYIAQTLVSALTFRGLPAVLRERGVDLQLVGLVSLTMLPWAFKFLWAPALERYRLPVDGQRRSRRVVLVGQAVVGLAFIAAALADPKAIHLLSLLLGVAATASATIDIACDAFAIEQLPTADRGWANTAQVGGSYFGAAIGGGLFLVLIAQAGWTVAGLAMAAMVILLTVPFVLGPEAAGPPHATPHRPSLAYAFKRPDVRRGLVLITLFTAGLSLALSMQGPFLIDAGMSLKSVGALTGVGGIVSGVVGAFGGGALVRWWGAGRAALVSLALQAVFLVALAAIAAAKADVSLAAGAVVALSTAMAFGYVCVYALLMDYSSPRQAGIDFTLFQCANALVQALLGAAGGFAAHQLGYGGAFALSAVLAVVGLAAMPMLLRRAPAEALA